MTCIKCKFSTHKDVIADPDRLKDESNLPRCTNKASKNNGSIVYIWQTCEEFDSELLSTVV